MRWFPFSSFHVPAIALYLSDHTLAVLRLNKDNSVISFGRTELASGIVENGKVLDKKKLAEHIRELCKNASPKPIMLTDEVPVILSVPESQSFTHLFTVPSATPEEKFKETVLSKAGELIPMDMTHLYVDWHVVERAVGATDRVLFAAAPRDIIDAYIAVCESCNLLPLAIDMETISLARALLSDDGKTSVIMDIGARTTTLGFFDEAHRLGLSVSIPIAGNSFTHAVIDHMHASWEDAEKLKREQGLDRMIPDNRVMVILQERLQAIMQELQKAFAYYESTYRKPVLRLVFAGGSSLLPDIVTYYAMNLKCEVVLGEPFRVLGKTNPQLADIHEPILFAPVVGLALRALAEHPEADGINLLHGWEGERWEEREEKILRRWRRLAVPIFVASIILLFYVAYAYLYLPYVRLHEENISRIALISGGNDGLVSTSTPALSDVATSGAEMISPPFPATTTTSESRETLIRIRETPTGWLNVRRSGASSSPAFAKIHPGETYPLLHEERGWAEITVHSGLNGWISTVYIERIP